MACQSCAANAAARNAMVARRMPEPVNIPDECVYSTEQIQSKIDELVLIKEDLNQFRAVRINAGFKIFKLRKALREYDLGCNRYYKDLTTIIG